MSHQVRCAQCAHEVPPGTLGRCPACGGILQPRYPDEAVGQLAKIQPGRGIDRYRPLLPVATPLPNLGEGDTPLIRTRRVGPSLGVEHLHLKNEGLNPSGAFKDRGAALAVALALQAGARGVLTASSGNASSALSAYCAAAGLAALILLEPSNPPAKLRQTLATGARVVPVEGIFGHGPEAIGELLLDVAARLDYYLAFVWAPVNPYILEGMKTISYEVVAQLGGAPDVVVCPVGGGDLLTAQWRGYNELQRAGIVERLPRMIAVQALRAPPLLAAFQAGADRVATLPYANSRISGINVPFSGEHALAAVRESGGVVVGVRDEAVFAAQRSLAVQEGVWVEPVGATALAALPWLLEQAELDARERVVCILSGAGFKDTRLAEAEALASRRLEPVAFDAAAIVAHVVGN